MHRSNVPLEQKVGRQNDFKFKKRAVGYATCCDSVLFFLSLAFEHILGILASVLFNGNKKPGFRQLMQIATHKQMHGIIISNNNDNCSRSAF
jgi:hypothetical protein